MKIWIFTPGWRLLIVPASLLVLTISSAIVGAHAETGSPDMELIEFLGDLETKGEDGFELLQFIDSSAGESSQGDRNDAQNEIGDNTIQGKTDDK